MLRSFLTLSLITLLASGCPGPVVECRVGADCATGVCRGDGTCAPAAVDGGADGGVGSDAGPDSGTDAGSDAGVDGGDAGTDGGTGCLPNNDGVIARSEIFTQAGLHATFRVSGATAFATAGVAQADGGWTWDFTTALAGDVATLVETQPITGKWFEADFPDAGYVAPLGQGTTLLAVFKSANDGLYLQGVASPTDGLTGTRLRYDPPVKVYGFPLRAGDTWTTDSTVTGKYQGVLIAVLQHDVYTSSVDRQGDALTPYSRFPVLRVRTVMNRSINFVPTLTLRTFSFVTECFGAVATIVSNDNEAATDFTQVKEVRRLSP